MAKLPIPEALARSYKFPRAFCDLEVRDMTAVEADYSVTLNDLAVAGDRIYEKCRGENILLLGPFGVGKTRVATWLGRRMLEAARREGGEAFEGWPPVYFVRAKQLGQYRFGRPQDEEDEEDAIRFFEAVRKIRNCHLLVIDDLSRMAGYKGESSFLEEVVEERYEEGLYTVMTASSEPDCVSARFADFCKYWKRYVLAAESGRA